MSERAMPKPNCTGQQELDLGVIDFGRVGRRQVAARRRRRQPDLAVRGRQQHHTPVTGHAATIEATLGLALGWEDLNDHKALRQDVAMQTAVGVDREVASAPTLRRLESWADRATAVHLSELLVEQFIASFERAPEELVLDFDAADNPLHGQQEQRFFRGYHDCCCYLPLYVSCGQQLLCAYLRPSRIDAAKHAAAILKLLVRRLRQAWPAVRIIFRGDSGFCRQLLINWCERSGVHYIIGLARNPKLEAMAEYAQLALHDEYQRTGTKQRLVDEFSYAAQSWPHERRVITRAHRADARLGAARHRAGQRADRYAAHQAAQACRGRHPQHAAHPAVLRLELAKRADLRAGHACAGQHIAPHPVPGPHVDTHQARNPSRGGGNGDPTTAFTASRGTNPPA
jgi:hypothetical protein